MSQLDNEMVHCIGCGAQLQSETENKAGFVPSSVLSKPAEELTDIYCKRCFRLRHYNEVSDVELTDDDFLTMLNEISSKNALVVNVIDVFDFNGSLISGMQRFAGNNPLIIVGNKIDLLPKALGEGRIRQWMTERVEEIGLRPVEVILTSALNKDSVQALMNRIDKIRRGRDVYVVGSTNVGKSTIINQIINIATDSPDVITTSYFPGTTLGSIEIPLDDGQAIIDTPGIILHSNLTNSLSIQDLKKVIPRREIKPVIYQLEEQQTVFLGGLARFDYEKGPGKQGVAFYKSNEVALHRTKLEKADEIYETHVGALLTPPGKIDADNPPKLVKHSFTVKQASDIVVSGLGWVSVHDTPAKVSMWAPADIGVYIRKAII